jgi:hypothetical protein
MQVTDASVLCADIDVIEAKLDDAVRRSIATVYNGSTSLGDGDLQNELKLMQEHGCKLPLESKKAAVFKLVSNSLERIHGMHIIAALNNKKQEMEEEEEEEQVSVHQNDQWPASSPCSNVFIQSNKLDSSSRSYSGY